MDIPMEHWAEFWRDCVRGMTIRGLAAKWATSPSSVQRAMMRIRQSSLVLSRLRPSNSKF
jgi:hypothetical protein